MARYNKKKFRGTTLPIHVLHRLDALKKRKGESRADVLTRVLDHFSSCPYAGGVRIILPTKPAYSYPSRPSISIPTEAIIIGR